MPGTTVATEPHKDAPIKAWADWVLDEASSDDETKARGLRLASVRGPQGLQELVMHIAYERGQS